MSRKKISILITTYNRSHCLAELLGRLLTMFGHEIRQGTTEILVFNDASIDETEAVCKACTPAIRYLTTHKNVGYMEARRRLITAAQGEYLVSLDDDSCFLDDDALDQIRAAFQIYPKCAVLAANIADPRTPAGQTPVEAKPIPVANFIGCGHILQANIIGNVGGYPKFLGGYGAEETILSLQLLEKNYQIMFLPNLRVYHAEVIHQRSFLKQRAGKLVNEIAIVISTYPLWSVLPLSFQKVVSHILFNWRHNTSKAVVLAAIQLPSMIWTALKHRRPISSKTLVQFYGLRKTFNAIHQPWRKANLCRWSEIDRMFVEQKPDIVVHG